MKNAFPVSGYNANGYRYFQEGMSLRDYFAAHALQGILAGRVYDSVPVKSVTHEAYELADKMMEARGER